jgi:hypothetical protein
MLFGDETLGKQLGNEDGAFMNDFIRRDQRASLLSFHHVNT